MGTLHLKVLGQGDPTRLRDPTFILRFVKDLIKLVGMRPLGEPTIHVVEEDIKKMGGALFEDEGGVTGQIVGYDTLSTSHLALHTWPLRGEYHLDIYSCREFDQYTVLGFVRDALRSEIIQAADLTQHCRWEIPPQRPQATL
jgi:S-adenosylmethionine/arginine decarboxylase-like enzyme